MPEMFPDVTISEVRIGAEKENMRFEVNTSNNKISQVKEELAKIFGTELAANNVKVDKVSPDRCRKIVQRENGSTPDENSSR